MKTTSDKVAEIKVQIEELQVWFAARPYGYRDLGPTQAQMMADREAEYEMLVEKLERLEG